MIGVVIQESTMYLRLLEAEDVREAHYWAVRAQQLSGGHIWVMNDDGGLVRPNPDWITIWPWLSRGKSEEYMTGYITGLRAAQLPARCS